MNLLRGLAESFSKNLYSGNRRKPDPSDNIRGGGGGSTGGDSTGDDSSDDDVD
jgi:hypothetical protein